MNVTSVMLLCNFFLQIYIIILFTFIRFVLWNLMNVYKIWIQVHLVSVLDLVSTYVHRGKLGSHMHPAKISVRLRTYLSFILFHG